MPTAIEFSPGYLSFAIRSLANAWAYQQDSSHTHSLKGYFTDLWAHTLSYGTTMNLSTSSSSGPDICLNNLFETYLTFASFGFDPDGY